MITGKQYSRSLSKNRNYSHAELAAMFDAYDRFVCEVFMQETTCSRDYFLKSVEFYFLEIYKRIDFIYKLAVRLETPGSLSVDRNHALVKRFHPCVIVVYSNNGRIDFGERIKYYRPMLMLEEAWQQGKRYEEATYWDAWVKHHLIRAKVYETFRYHCKFMSSDYDEISGFIREYYNMLGYHEPNKRWILEDRERKAEREARVTKALEINEALFGDSDKRKPEKWTPPDKSDDSKA